MPGSTASKSSNLRNGLNKIKLVALRHTNTRIFRFLFVSKARDFGRFSSQFRNTINSLLNISYSQATEVVPYRLKVKAVKRGDTVRSFARQMSVNYKEETFRVINGLRRHDTLRPGQLVKIISE